MKTFKKFSIFGVISLFVLTGYILYEMEHHHNTIHKSMYMKSESLQAKNSLNVPEKHDFSEILNSLDTNPTSAGPNSLTETANSITREALNAFSPTSIHSLPLLSHSQISTGALSPMEQIDRIEQGEHILVTWNLDAYYESSLGQDYYEDSIKRAKSLNLPLVFLMPSPESALLYNDYYASMNIKNTPSVVTNQNSKLKKLSPFVNDTLWKEVAKEQATMYILKKIQEWYPNPPLIVFTCKDETPKLQWSEIETSSRYIKRYSIGQDDNFKRTLIASKWIEKYRVLHESFKDNLTQSAWKRKSKFISNNRLSEDMGKAGWQKNATFTNLYTNIWPLTADGITVNFELKSAKDTYSSNSPQTLINNLPFMLGEANEINPSIATKLSIKDNGLLNDKDDYKGFAQFALWFLRPSIVEQSSTSYNDEFFNELSNSIELIYQNETLKDFWLNGELLENKVQKNINNINLNNCNNKARWYILNDDSLDITSFMLKMGNKYLLYAQSKNKAPIKTKITVNDDFSVNTDIDSFGSFYYISENLKVEKIVAVTDIEIPSMKTIKPEYKIYDSTLYKSKPIELENIFPHINILYAQSLLPTPNAEEPDVEFLKQVALNLEDSSEPYILDIEHWDVHNQDDAIVEENIDKYILVIDTMKEARPDLKFGYYAVLPNRDYWTPVNNNTEKLLRWDNINERLKRLALHVDVVCPSLYTFYDDEEGWEKYAVENIKRAREYNKPVYPFILPEYHDGGDPKLRGTYLSPSFWNKQLELLYNESDGIIIWGGWNLSKENYGAREWDDNAQWWNTTKKFIVDMNEY